MTQQQPIANIIAPNTVNPIFYIIIVLYTKSIPCFFGHSLYIK